MVRLLMTGADGFVGSNVLEYMLSKTDWEFVCISSGRHEIRRIKPSERVKIYNFNLINPLRDIGDFDYIINLASESHVDRSIADPVNSIENNISSTLQVLEYARKHSPKVFIQFSTDEVYGAMYHKEWDVLLPSNPYAASKASQEMIAIAYWKTYGVPLVITNSNNIVGKNQDPEKFVPKIIEIIKNGGEVTIHTANGKPGRRYWNPVQNTADALLFILSLDPKMYSVGRLPDRYALSGGKELNNLEMAQLIAKTLNKPLHYKLVDAETVRPGYDEFYAIAEGALDNRGWEPLITLEEGLEWVE